MLRFYKKRIGFVLKILTNERQKVELEKKRKRECWKKRSMLETKKVRSGKGWYDQQNNTPGVIWLNKGGN